MARFKFKFKSVPNPYQKDKDYCICVSSPTKRQTNDILITIMNNTLHLFLPRVYQPSYPERREGKKASLQLHNMHASIASPICYVTIKQDNKIMNGNQKFVLYLKHSRHLTQKNYNIKKGILMAKFYSFPFDIIRCV